MSKVDDILSRSGLLDNWLGNANQSYEAAPVVKQQAPKSNYLGDIVKSAGVLGGMAGKILAQPVISAGNMIAGTQRNLGLDSRAAQAENARKALDKQDIQMHSDLKSGKLSKAQFQAGQKDLMGKYQGVSDQAGAINKDYYGAGQVAQDYGNVAAGVITTAAPFLKPLALAAGGAEAGAGIVARTAAGLDRTLATSSAAKGAVGALIKAPIRNALVTAPVVQTGLAIPQDLAKGNMAGAAANAAMLAAPGIIGGAAKVMPKVGEALSTSLYGKQGFFSAVKAAGGPDVLTHMDGLTGAAKTELEGILRQVQQKNLDEMAGGDVKNAARHFVEYLTAEGRDVSKIKPQDMVNELRDWVEGNLIGQKAYAKGKLFNPDTVKTVKIPNPKFLTAEETTGIPATISKKVVEKGAPLKLAADEHIIAARFDASKKNALRTELVAAKSPEERLAILTRDKQAGADYTKTTTLYSRLTQEVGKSDSEWRAGFEKVTSLKSLYAEGKKLGMPRGYVLAVTKNARADFKAVEDTAALDRGKEAGKVLGKVGALLTKAGISTESGGGQYAIYKANLTGRLKQIEGLKGEPDQVIRALGSIRENGNISRIGIHDERQLGIGALKDVLDVNGDVARKVQQALTSAYKDMSTADVSLAGKIQNAMFKVPGYRKYSQVQGALRYELNPFFRLQERTETEVLSQLKAGGKEIQAPGSDFVRRLFGQNSNEVDSTVSLLKKHDIFKGAFQGGESANNATFSQISAQLTRPQQESIAGLVNNLAAKSGQGAEDYIKTMDRAALDNIREVVQYPSKGFASSNFAKTLNIIAFPSRYNIKLAGILGKELVKASPGVQIATLKGIQNYNDFMNSDEGIKFKAENSEALGVIAYLNPLNNLNAAFKLITGKHVSVSDLGVIGGLPLGVITMALQHSGLTPPSNTPYLNPKTGEVVPDQIPANLSGSVKQVMADLINSMYSFPGRTFGTGISKTQLTQKIPGLAPSKGEFTPVTRTDLTPEQQRIQRVLGAGAAKGSSVRSVPVVPKGVVRAVTPVKRGPGAVPKPKVRRAKILAKRTGSF